MKILEFFTEISNRLNVNFIIILFFMLISNLNCWFNDDTDNIPPAIPYAPGEDWTIMVYADGDNDLEQYLLLDIDEMKNGFVNNQGINLIVLVDRIDGYSELTDGFGENFTDTRLYRISGGLATRIGGSSQFSEITLYSSFEANMGDANTLKKFIQFCKANYTTRNYALILWNHGAGPRKKRTAGESLSTYKNICIDETSGSDSLYTAEITDVLTANESVDLIGFDACLMGSVEVAYQYRPGNGGFNAQVMVASPSLEWGFGWEYNKILERINATSGNNGENNDVIESGYELFYDASIMTALDLGNIIVEEQYDSTQNIATPSISDSLSCYDLSEIDSVKNAVDMLALQLDSENEKEEFESIRGSGASPPTIHYFNSYKSDEWLTYPFFDLYDLCEGVNSSALSADIKARANNVKAAIKDMIVCSFAGNDFVGFTNKENGIYIFFPDGDREVYNADDELLRSWMYQWWYNAIDINSDYADNFLYGKLDWCANKKDGDSAAENNGVVENWFELLDKWFDYTSINWPTGPENFPDGGSNSYNW